MFPSAPFALSAALAAFASLASAATSGPILNTPGALIACQPVQLSPSPPPFPRRLLRAPRPSARAACARSQKLGPGRVGRPARATRLTFGRLGFASRYRCELQADDGFCLGLVQLGPEEPRRTIVSHFPRPR